MSEETTDESTNGVDLPEFTGNSEDSSEPNAENQENTKEILAADLEAVFDVPVTVSAILGRTEMEVSTLLQLQRGAIVELDRKVGEAIDIFVNDRLVARGEIVLVEEQLGVTMTEIIQAD